MNHFVHCCSFSTSNEITSKGCQNASQTCYFDAKNAKFFWEVAQPSLQTPPPVGRGTPPPHTPPHPTPHPTRRFRRLDLNPSRSEILPTLLGQTPSSTERISCFFYSLEHFVKRPQNPRLRNPRTKCIPSVLNITSSFFSVLCVKFYGANERILTLRLSAVFSAETGQLFEILKQTSPENPFLTFLPPTKEELNAIALDVCLSVC